ncbi:MAG: hypothetical protein JWP85_2574 [Rhodoglobus sp.]|nr:hypothetical protein [Rhodoglobus sp.]
MKLAVRRTSTAIAAVATAGVSTLFMGVAPAGAATADACGDGVLIAPGVCEQTFTSGSAAFTPTADMTKLEVLLVGAGGAGADQPVPNTNGYAAAGGGGEVKIVDFSGATAPLNLTVAAPGVAGTVSDGTTNEAVANGADGSGATGGSSGSGFAGASGFGNPVAPYGAGGGAAASPTTNADGGAGVVVNTLVPSGSLFSDDTNCYGGGGAIGAPTVQGIPGCGGGGPADSTGTTLAAPLANSGGGGGGLNITQSAAARAGASGVVVIRWNGATAALTFDASGHGVAPAVQTVVAGTAAVRPADPTASGWEFKGWYTDAQLTTLADFSVLLTSSTTYYAAWAPALAPTGAAADLAALPIGIAALFAGAGLVAVAYNRKRRAN